MFLLEQDFRTFLKGKSRLLFYSSRENSYNNYKTNQTKTKKRRKTDKLVFKVYIVFVYNTFPLATRFARKHVAAFHSRFDERAYF